MSRPVFLPTTFHSGGTISQLRQKLARRSFEVWCWRVLWVSWLAVHGFHFIKP